MFSNYHIFTSLLLVPWTSCEQDPSCGGTESQCHLTGASSSVCTLQWKWAQMKLLNPVERVSSSRNTIHRCGVFHLCQLLLFLKVPLLAYQWVRVRPLPLSSCYREGYYGRVLLWEGVTMAGCYYGRVLLWEGVTMGGCYRAPPLNVCESRSWSWIQNVLALHDQYTFSVRPCVCANHQSMQHKIHYCARH